MIVIQYSAMFTADINLLFNFYTYIRKHSYHQLLLMVANRLKYIIACLGLLVCTAPAFAQIRSFTPDLKNFNKRLIKANITFTYPAGFKEVKVNNTPAYSFDYGIVAPEGDCEIWFKVQSQKDTWSNYLKAKNDNRIAHPDSLYQEIGLAQARAFKNDKEPLARSIPPMLLTRYNADLGKTYLVNLPDAPETKHYKYAMVVVLQKNKVGNVLAVCFANELGPGFFKNLNKASTCLKFNPS